MKLMRVGIPLFFLSFALSTPIFGGAGNPSVAGCQDGGILRAIERAYREFHNFLSASSATAQSNELFIFLSKIDNYEIVAALENGVYIVKFYPHAYPGGGIRGAGAQYHINKCTFQIEEIRGQAPLE